MSGELKPCPDCNSSSIMIDDTCDGFVQVFCERCLRATDWYYADTAEEIPSMVKEAINAWNNGEFEDSI